VSLVDEPVRRYLSHALGEGAASGSGVRMKMSGRIKVWLPFTAEERCDARSFEWRARVGWGPVSVLEVVDGYADGQGSTCGRLLGRATLFEQTGRDTARSAAGRTALEAAVWAPASLLGSDVEWRADSEREIVATWDIPPERPEVHLRIDGRGAIKSAVAMRWGSAGQKHFSYISCGCEVHAERQFGELLLPSRVTVGWWFDTPRYTPFFRTDVIELSRSP
jgi:hypothetical protein